MNEYDEFLEASMAAIQKISDLRAISELINDAEMVIGYDKLLDVLWKVRNEGITKFQGEEWKS